MGKLFVIFLSLFIFPPAEANVANYEQGNKPQVDDPGIYTGSGTIAQLLGSFGANRALSGNSKINAEKKKQQSDFVKNLHNVNVVKYTTIA